MAEAVLVSQLSALLFQCPLLPLKLQAATGHLLLAALELLDRKEPHLIGIEQSPLLGCRLIEPPLETL